MSGESKDRRKYQSYTQEDLTNALNLILAGETIRHASKQCNIPTSTLARKMKEDDPSKLKNIVFDGFDYLLCL